MHFKRSTDLQLSILNNDEARLPLYFPSKPNCLLTIQHATKMRYKETHLFTLSDKLA